LFLNDGVDFERDRDSWEFLLYDKQDRLLVTDSAKKSEYFYISFDFDKDGELSEDTFYNEPVHKWLIYVHFKYKNLNSLTIDIHELSADFFCSAFLNMKKQ
jgi:hypothetical protein